jgi:hypothetical protein
MMTPETFKRICPKCGKTVVHVNEDSYKHSVAVKSVCRSCRNLDRVPSYHNSKSRNEKSRIRFVDKMAVINPHLQVYYKNSLEAGGRCSKHDVEFSGTVDKIKKQESCAHKELEETIELVLVRQHGLSLTEADGYTKLVRYIRGKILSSVRQTGEKPTEQMVRDRVAEINVTSFLSNSREDFLEEQREARGREATKQALVHVALREQSQYPGSTLCHLESGSGNDKIYYLKLRDGHFKIVGKPELLKDLRSLHGEIQPPGLKVIVVEAPISSSFDPRPPPSAPLPEIIQKYQQRLEALDIDIPEPGHEVFLFRKTLGHGNVVRICFLLNHHSGVYVYCYRPKFNTPDELFDYLETLNQETFERDSTVATPIYK